MASFLMSCNAKKAIVSAEPETEFEQLDTLVISAPTPVEIMEEEDFVLPTYNPSATRTIDLLDTDLQLSFNWEKEQVNGVATLTFKPLFYPIEEATLDAKGFTFNSIKKADGTALEYDYDGQQVVVDLDREYSRTEEIKLVIDYVASPSESGGSSAITSDKGLFFINSDGSDPETPMQIWTQGETEHNSRWFPTVDKPNERCTQSMAVTVQNRFKTLSNGVFLKSEENSDGTRTDYYRMDLPHAPYLFMLAVGEFSVTRETWEGIPVEYFVEPKFAAYAKDIFPHTPEMLTFFSELIGYKYPWPKFSQVIVREYVSGAMENTTGVIYGDFMQLTDRDLVDVLINEKIVAHEMFHHWFGDLVTCESWANLTLNEGFANYSEYLWLEHKYGRDEADYHRMSEKDGYLQDAMRNMHPLIHFGYRDKEDMFDGHSYNKGGLVLHMLRDYLGDEAFFAGLQRYLSDNQYSAVEVDELRMAFEDVSGQDLNWFFDQWYLEQGHPVVEIETVYNESDQELVVQISQIQDAARMPAIFQLPTSIDIHLADGTVRNETIWIDERVETVAFSMTEAPAVVILDPKKVLLMEYSETKFANELKAQYKKGKSLEDRYGGIVGLLSEYPEDAQDVLQKAIKDPFWDIRSVAVNNVEPFEGLASILSELAKNDPHSAVRSAALERMADMEVPDLKDAAMYVIENEKSYEVVGIGLQALYFADEEAGLAKAESLEGVASPDLLNAVGTIYTMSSKTDKLDFFETNWMNMASFEVINFMDGYVALASQGDRTTIDRAVDKLGTIGVDQGDAGWRRLGAINALNSLHEYTADPGFQAANTDWEEIDGKVKEAIQAIKDAETNSQLKAIYMQFPSN